MFPENVFTVGVTLTTILSSLSQSIEHALTFREELSTTQQLSNGAESFIVR